jgi:FAD/FMN-containing dehydrogenase
MIDQTKIDEFKASLRGELVLPGDEKYNDARKVYNAMIDKKPAMIAYCADVTDVMNSVNFGRDNKMLIAARGGGHNGGGLGICDGGLVIDLSRIKNTRVDPKTKTVRAGGG